MVKIGLKSSGFLDSDDEENFLDNMEEYVLYSQIKEIDENDKCTT